MQIKLTQEQFMEKYYSDLEKKNKQLENLDRKEQIKKDKEFCNYRRERNVGIYRKLNKKKGKKNRIKQ